MIPEVMKGMAVALVMILIVVAIGMGIGFACSGGEQKAIDPPADAEPVGQLEVDQISMDVGRV